MKKIIFWLTMIVGIIAVVGACKKSDDSTTTTSTSCAGSSSLTEVSSCSSTPSGSITGIDNMTFTGVYSLLHYFGIIGTSGYDNETDCVSSSSGLSDLAARIGAPTGAAGLIMNTAVTSSSSFAERVIYYSDTSCSTEIANFTQGYSDVTIVDNVTGLTTSVGDNTFSSTATKVTYKETCMGIKGSTDAGVTWIKSFLSSASVDPTVGTAYICGDSGDTKYALMHVDNSSPLGAALTWEESSSAQPTDWSSDTDTLTFLP